MVHVLQEEPAFEPDRGRGTMAEVGVLAGTHQDQGARAQPLLDVVERAFGREQRDRASAGVVRIAQVAHVRVAVLELEAQRGLVPMGHARARLEPNIDEQRVEAVEQGLDAAERAAFIAESQELIGLRGRWWVGRHGSSISRADRGHSAARRP